MDSIFNYLLSYMNYSKYLEGIFALATLLKVKEETLGLFLMVFFLFASKYLEKVWVHILAFQRLNQSASRLCKLWREEICCYSQQHLNQSPFKDDENAGEDAWSGRPWGDDAYFS